MRKLVGEALGTFLLVLGGTGAAVLSAKVPSVGVGMLGVAFAFGLSLLAGVSALGQLTGGHFNPAVTVGAASAGRFAWRDVPGYVGAQLLGAIVASGVVLALASGHPGGYDAHSAGLAANGYDVHSPGGYGLGAALLSELVFTFLFVSVILGVTAKLANPVYSGLAMGLMLTLVHIVSIPITNTSVNPARSTAPALFVGGWALRQLWLFWVAPLAGALAAGYLARWLHAGEAAQVEAAEHPWIPRRPSPSRP